MTQVCDDAILQCCREVALTLRRTLKSACHCFDERKPHFRKSTVCGDSISHTRIIFCFLYSIQKCSFILWLCLDSLKSLGHQRSLPFSIPFCALWLSSTAAANSVEFLYLSTLLVPFIWRWRTAKISKTCQWQLSPEMIPFLYLALFLLLQFGCIGYILSILNISQNTALLEISPLRECKIVCSMRGIQHWKTVNIMFVRIALISWKYFTVTSVQTPFCLSCYAATSTCGIISAASLPASFFLPRFLLEPCQLLALPGALLFSVPWEVPGLSQKPVQNEKASPEKAAACPAFPRK